MPLEPRDPPLSDGLVMLRPPDERDLAAIDLGIHDPDVVRWFGRPASSAADVLAENRTRWADGSPTFSICEMDGECVGHAWVNLGTNDASIGYVGYWLLPNARGRGLATRAVRLLSEWAVHHLGLTLRLVTELGNERSQRVAERSGFRRSAILPGRGEIDGRPVDQVLYTLPMTGR
jgi:RimJ/RimL family protein N-acetyltransferase